MAKIIFLDVKSGIFVASKHQIDGCQVEQVDLYRSDMNKYLLKILRRLNCLCSLTLGGWKKNKEKYDYAILPDGLMTVPVIKHIGKHPVAKTQILYFWNKIGPQEEIFLNVAKEYGFSVMTYNKHDVDKYGILYNQQVWDKTHLESIKSSDQITQDVYFTGYVKDRYAVLCDIKKQLETRGIKTKFNMVSPNGEEGTVTKGITYSEYLNDCNQSRAVLDVVMQNNLGLTLRPLEALFMKKKLITNYTQIKEYDFYEFYKKNIFIWGEDDIEQISDFISSPFEEPAQYFDLDSYDIHEWVKRFCI